MRAEAADPSRAGCYAALGAEVGADLVTGTHAGTTSLFSTTGFKATTPILPSFGGAPVRNARNSADPRGIASGWMMNSTGRVWPLSAMAQTACCTACGAASVRVQ